VTGGKRNALVFEVTSERVDDGHRSVTAAGTPDRQGEVCLSFLLVAREEEVKEGPQVAEESLGIGLVEDEARHGLLFAGVVAQIGYEVRVGQPRTACHA